MLKKKNEDFNDFFYEIMRWTEKKQASLSCIIFSALYYFYNKEKKHAVRCN